MHAFLSTVGAHPQLALFVVGLTAFAESVAIVGTLVPAGIVMFGAGALVGADSLALWPTLMIAAVGAVAGDGVSYELGRARQAQVRAWPPMQRRAGAIARGEAFVHRHGGKSIVLARFTGPVRAFVPLLVGFAHMPRLRFYPVNVVSALLWAPVHILPGVLFGTSLQLAEAVSGRLAVVILLLVLFVWGAGWLVASAIRVGVPVVRRARESAVGHARGRSSWLARLTLALLDPQRPGSEALLLGAVLLLAAGWLFLGVVEDVLSHDPLVQADVAVFQFLRQLHTAAFDRWMVAASLLGSLYVMLPLAAVVTLWLLWRRCWRTVLYWLGVVGFAELLVELLKRTLGRRRPLDLYLGVEHFSFPSGHATTSTVVLGFLAFLLSRGQSLRLRLGIAVITTVYVALVAFSRLYLGAHWLSDVVGGISLGLAWIALAAMVCGQRRLDEDIAARRLMAVVALTVTGFGGLWIERRAPAELARYAVPVEPQRIAVGQWLGSAWQSVPARRSEFAGEPDERFDLQWACSEAGIRTALNQTGWRPAPAWSVRTALAWLAPRAPLAALPVLPRFDRGRRARLSFVRASATRPDAREVLRLWRADADLVSDAEPAVALWYGALYRETRRPGGHRPTPSVQRVAMPAEAFVATLPADVRRHTPDPQPGATATVLLVCPRRFER